MDRKSLCFNRLRLKCLNTRGIACIFYRKLFALYSFVLGYDIKYSTQIGDNFEIFHGARGTVINPNTVIGNNVTVRQNTTIGAKGFHDSEKCPRIEDNVTVGPNACVIGDITIGHHSVIGAGAVVVKDVPAYSVVAGNPAKVIKMLNPKTWGGKISIKAFSRFAA